MPPLALTRLCSVTRGTVEEPYTTSCGERLPSPAAFEVRLVDIERRVPPEDNHASGLHVNLLWLDPDSRRVRRYDPYYAPLAHCDDMQEALDAALERVAPHGYAVESSRVWREDVPFGPEFVEACAHSVPRGEGEEYCALWSVALARHVTPTQVEAATAVRALLRELGVVAPTTPEETRAAAAPFLAAVRAAAAPVPPHDDALP